MTFRRRAAVLAAGGAGALLLVIGSPVTASAAPTYTTANVTLNIRSGPSTGYSIVGTLPASSKVLLYCQTPGTTVTGTYGTSNIWDNISSGEYISDAYVNTGSDGYVTSRCG
ncbi:SH3 domain-containing protein [Streptomyces sp. NPDC001073]|uniref:SH3 domain-containing protein n=1 Tax=Streptomyces sp. NPDC001642 TaxID=3154392 RepID=UPI00331ACF7D